MSVIHNLVQSGFIKVGTWVGVPHGSTRHINQLVVTQVLQTDHVICHDVKTQNKYQVPFSLIQQVDGMILSRFLLQADLTPQGVKKENQLKRGRKPKVRS